jgi:hypothetical protein
LLRRAGRNRRTATKDTPAIYVLDGEQRSFAYDRTTAVNKITIGLTDEGDKQYGFKNFFH